MTHLGTVRVQPITDRLIELAKAEEYLSRKYVMLKLKAVQKRERCLPGARKDCLRRIIDYAASKRQTGA